nr:uncharacterized protein LOC110439912 [Danio rerio]|eukprot:XP_021333327.1 uncharacterized protein LOC110439912 [Danio rerio]
MASPEHCKRRDSIEEPPSIADALEELNRLHDNASSGCREHIKKMTGLVNEFEEDYKRATRNTRTGEIATRIGEYALITGVTLSIFTAGISAIVGGIISATAAAGATIAGAAGAVAAVAGGIIVAMAHFQKQQIEKNTRQNFENQLTELQNKIYPVIDVLQKLFNLTQKKLRDPSISEHKANMIRECFSCFEQIQLFKIDDNIGVTAPMSKAKHLNEHFSKVFTEMNSLLEILKEIIEDDIEDDKDKNEDTDNRPTDKASTGKKVNEKEFTKKTETFIDEMNKGINTLKNTMNEIDQIKIRLSQRFK